MGRARGVKASHTLPVSEFGDLYGRERTDVIKHFMYCLGSSHLFPSNSNEQILGTPKFGRSSSEPLCPRSCPLVERVIFRLCPCFVSYSYLVCLEPLS